jgi:hypothetical protein
MMGRHTEEEEEEAIISSSSSSNSRVLFVRVFVCDERAQILRVKIRFGELEKLDESLDFFPIRGEEEERRERSLSLSLLSRERERDNYREKRCVVIFPISSAITLFVVVFICSEEENHLRLHRLVW